MIFVVPKSTITTSEIAALRKLSRNSFAEIKRACESGEPIIRVEPFSTSWEEDRLLLVEVVHLLEGDGEHLVYVCEGESERDSEALSSPEFKARLHTLREIELDQQRQSDLEMGYIASPEEFEPHDEEWL